MQCTQILRKQDGCSIYAIMKTMCPSGHHHNGFVAIHASQVYELPQSHCGDNREGALFS